jgi:UDP-perosamine 4-acetyltransferase
MGADSLSPCVILGGGGHASVVIEAMVTGRAAAPRMILDSDRTRWGKTLLDVPIVGGDDLLADLARKGITHFVVGVGGVGDNGRRRRLYEQAQANGLTPVTVQHPMAVRSGWSKVGEGSVLLAGSVVNAGAVLGKNVILNTGAIIEHDCTVGDHVHVATGATVAGSVRIGEGVHIGAGATVRQGITIGRGAVIGAGAVVIKDVAPGMVVVGVPARPLSRGKKTAGRGRPGKAAARLKQNG